MQKNQKIIQIIIVTAIFGAFSAILYTVPGLQFKIPLAPSFMEIHLDEIPILISGFAYGPVVVVLELLLKTIIKLPASSSLGVGELGDIMYSLALILPAVIIYKKHRNFKGAIIGLSVGLLINLFFTSVINLYTIFPIYKSIYGMPDGAISSAFDVIYHMGLSGDGDIRIALLLLPFNAIKNAIVIAVTIVAYKPLRFVIEKSSSLILRNSKVEKTEPNIINVFQIIMMVLSVLAVIAMLIGIIFSITRLTFISIGIFALSYIGFSTYIYRNLE